MNSRVPIVLGDGWFRLARAVASSGARSDVISGIADRRRRRCDLVVAIDIGWPVSTTATLKKVIGNLQQWRRGMEIAYRERWQAEIARAAEDLVGV